MYTLQHLRNYCIEVISRIRLAVSGSLLMFGDFTKQEADYKDIYNFDIQDM